MLGYLYLVGYNTLFATLAPSPRVLAHLLRRGRIPARDMALTVVEPPANDNAADSLPAPPAVVTTPCDPWPRPYYLQDGLRRVAPYHFTYNTNVKERWRGRGILEIFRDEFRDRPEEYYVCPKEEGTQRKLHMTNTRRKMPSKRARSKSTASPLPPSTPTSRTATLLVTLYTATNHP